MYMIEQVEALKKNKKWYIAEEISLLVGINMRNARDRRRALEHALGKRTTNDTVIHSR